MSFADICIVFADTSKCFHACRYSCTYLQNPLEKNVFFYIIFTINEYLAASEQPTFTVTYAYTLPSSLSVGEIYLFKNAGSGKYMDVQNGTDANDTNVIQWGWNGSPAQQYKLEKSSTGNGYILRSQVGGKTRVLDIYKTNGRVENGNNVQIYRNVDPIAQEWLIIPVNSANYKIVPRSNPALALTSYGSSNGSASGKSTTSAGNVFVSTYTGNNTNQWWSIERENGVFIQPGTTLLEDGEYYLNSRSTSKYLRNVSGSVQGANGTTAALGTSIKWKFTNMGGKYLIQPANNTSLYLSGGSTTDSATYLVTVGSYIPAECLWTVTKSNPYSNQITIKSNIGRTLCSIGSTINAEIYPPMNDEWRAVTSVVDPPNNFPVTCDRLLITESKSPKIGSINATFKNNNDFSYSISYQSPTNCISLSVVNGAAKITANLDGSAAILVTHKPSGITSTLNVFTDLIDLEFGLFSENYIDIGHELTSGCYYGERNSKQNADSFYNAFNQDVNKNIVYNTVGVRRETGSLSFNLSKTEFFHHADTVDFLVYVGHGIAADRTAWYPNYNDPNKGNFLHLYWDNTPGTTHFFNCTGDENNIYTSEVEFGASNNSKLRWVWLYSCSFLATNAYVTDNDLKQMMQGAHIVMGYTTSTLLHPEVGNRFGQELAARRPIIDSFFVAGDQVEALYAEDNHQQKVLFMQGAREETIYALPVSYGKYPTSDVEILTNRVHDAVIWK